MIYDSLEDHKLICRPTMIDGSNALLKSKCFMMKFYWLQGQRGEGLVRLKHVVIDANHEKAPKKKQ